MKCAECPIGDDCEERGSQEVLAAFQTPGCCFVDECGDHTECHETCYIRERCWIEAKGSECLGIVGENDVVVYKHHVKEHFDLDPTLLERVRGTRMIDCLECHYGDVCVEHPNICCLWEVEEEGCNEQECKRKRECQSIRDMLIIVRETHRGERVKDA